jgi:hypothetical protein
VLNLVLVLGVIRRLREQTTTAPYPHGPLRPPVMAPGVRPEPVTATALDGAPVGQDLAGRLVGFFAPGCSLCHERMPEFLAYASHFERSDVLAVLVGTPDETAELAGALGRAARPVVEEVNGPLARAFAVHGLPAVCLLDAEGVVVASGTDLAGFPPVPARYPA